MLNSKKREILGGTFYFHSASRNEPYLLKRNLQQRPVYVAKRSSCGTKLNFLYCPACIQNALIEQTILLFFPQKRKKEEEENEYNLS